MPEWWKGIDAALEAHQAPEAEEKPPRRSSVAAIIELRPDPHVLLMKRVHHERDPWSGHVSLPGGRAEPQDSNLLATAIRETLEEVEIDLDQCARLIGQLAPRQAISLGRPQGMDVTPFIFRLDQTVEPIPKEEAEVLFWLPLALAADGAFDAEHRFERGGQIHTTPCWNYEDFVIWGMTYRILSNLITICRSC